MTGWRLEQEGRRAGIRRQSNRPPPRHAGSRRAGDEGRRRARDRALGRAPKKAAQSAAEPFAGELRKRGVLPLLVLHFIADGPSYGNQLMERIAAVTEGVLQVNPNTMYPLLRQLEARGLIEGKWEHPERRSRRYYSLTPAGRKEYKRTRQGRAAVARLGGGAAYRRSSREVYG